MAAGVEEQRSEARFAVRGHVRAFKSGPAIAGSPHSKLTRSGETETHARLKQLAFIWAQTQGFSACAMEVTLPRCRYRADVAGYRKTPKYESQTACLTR